MGKQTFFCFNAALGTLHKLPYKHCCTTLNVFIWLTVKCSSTTCKECITALPLQQWLCKNETMLCYTYTVNLIRVPLRLSYPSFVYYIPLQHTLQCQPTQEFTTSYVQLPHMISNRLTQEKLKKV